MINLALALVDICVKFVASLISAAVAAVEAVVDAIVDAFMAFVEWAIEFITDVINGVFSPIIAAVEGVLSGYFSGISVALHFAGDEMASDGTVGPSASGRLMSAFYGNLLWAILIVSGAITAISLALFPITISFGFVAAMILTVIVSFIALEMIGVSGELFTSAQSEAEEYSPDTDPSDDSENEAHREFCAQFSLKPSDTQTVQFCAKAVGIVFKLMASGFACLGGKLAKGLISLFFGLFALFSGWWEIALIGGVLSVIFIVHGVYRWLLPTEIIPWELAASTFCAAIGFGCSIIGWERR